MKINGMKCLSLKDVNGIPFLLYVQNIESIIVFPLDSLVTDDIKGIITDVLGHRYYLGFESLKKASDAFNILKGREQHEDN